MHLKTPPMGWNSWNTFGDNISDAIIRETADAMADQHYLAAGYRYVIIDDAWMCRERDSNGRFVPDPEKFPYGIKPLADYVHSKGLLLGIYSCAGTRTCGGYPGSFDHEFEDARQFAKWGVDYLKYDFCNFPSTGDGRHRYQVMSMALRASGRDIFFAACNWGKDNPEKWMRSLGANSYRSTYDILDCFSSCASIARSQLDLLYASASPCFNDMDMLTVGMYGKGHVGLSDPNNTATAPCTDRDYETQFALWATMGSALILGGDIRNMPVKSRELLQNSALIAINQDDECRPPYVIWQYKGRFCFVRHMSDRSLVLVYANTDDNDREVECSFVDLGLPYHSGYKLRLYDVLAQREEGIFADYYHPIVPGHGCRVFRATFEQA